MPATNAFPTYRLSFRSPVRIGERGVGLEVSRARIPADTLFGAICSAWRDLYGADDLETELLAKFTADETQAPPFLLTSAFPFAGAVRLLPRPFAAFSAICDEEHAKPFRRVNLVSARVFAALTANQELRFDPEHCVNNGQVWLTAEEKSALPESVYQAGDEPAIWRHAVVPRVTLDRITSASAIWHLGSVGFAKDCGLWFSARFDDSASPELRQKFDGALRLLGDTGLGGERGAGHGLFNHSVSQDDSLPQTENASQFVTLSPCCPKDAAQAEALAGEGASYELIARRGWVTSPEAGNLRRQTVWMFAEGSVLNGGLSQPHGRLVNATPDPSPHPVWRYGYAFPVEVTS